MKGLILVNDLLNIHDYAYAISMDEVVFSSMKQGTSPYYLNELIDLSPVTDIFT